MTDTELWQCPVCKTVRAIPINDGYISCKECKATMKLICKVEETI